MTPLATSSSPKVKRTLGVGRHSATNVGAVLAQEQSFVPPAALALRKIDRYFYYYLPQVYEYLPHIHYQHG